MGILKRSADLVYTFRLIKMLSMKWEDFDAYKLGIIDENGKRNRNVKLDTSEKKDAYTPFIRMAVNIKRITRGNRFLGFASGLFLIKEQLGLSDKQLDRIINEADVDALDIMKEDTSTWFLQDDGNLVPGKYKLKIDKLLNESCDDLAFAGDTVRIWSGVPLGDILGHDIFLARHERTGRDVYITAGEILK